MCKVFIEKLNQACVSLGAPELTSGQKSAIRDLSYFFFNDAKEITKDNRAMAKFFGINAYPDKSGPLDLGEMLEDFRHFEVMRKEGVEGMITRTYRATLVRMGMVVPENGEWPAASTQEKGEAPRDEKKESERVVDEVVGETEKTIGQTFEKRFSGGKEKAGDIISSLFRKIEGMDMQAVFVIGYKMKEAVPGFETAAVHLFEGGQTRNPDRHRLILMTALKDKLEDLYREAEKESESSGGGSTQK